MKRTMGARAVMMVIFATAWGLGGALTGCSPRTPASARILLVGIDGADWQYIDPLIAEGRLPNFARLSREGARGELQSLRGRIMSPVVWTTIGTGKGPQEHGIMSYTVADPSGGGDTQVTSTLRREKAFWNILTERGRRVCVVGYCVTWPVEEVSGVMVSSFLPFADAGAGREFSHVAFPDSLTPQMMGLRLGATDVTAEMLAPFVGTLRWEDLQPGDEQESWSVLRWAIACDETFHRAALALMTPAPDVMAVYLGSVDRVGHRFMKYRDPAGCGFTPRPAVAASYGRVLDETYVFVDRILGDLVAAAGPGTTLIVVSDHGFRSIKPEEQQKGGWEWHRREGICLLAGEGVRPGAPIVRATVFDITPTMLYLLALPLAEDMRGKPLVDAFSDEMQHRRRPAPVRSYGPREMTEAERQFVRTPAGEKELELLRSLGYIR